MPEDPAAILGYQRYREGAFVSKQVDDVLFSTISVRTTRERLLRHLPNVTHIPAMFWTNVNF